jgi:hypothetical protein
MQKGRRKDGQTEMAKLLIAFRGVEKTFPVFRQTSEILRSTLNLQNVYVYIPTFLAEVPLGSIVGVCKRHNWNVKNVSVNFNGERD